MISLKLLGCFMTLWCISHALNNALFFNWEEQKLVEMSKFDKEAQCQSCLSACPASDLDKEELRNYGVLVTGEVIFLKEVYDVPTTAGEMKIEVCEKPLSPGLVWDTDVNSFEVGYEMYYEEGQVDLKTSTYDNYVKVVRGEPSIEPTETPDEDKVKIYKQADNTKFELVGQPKKKLVFYFINVLSIDVFNENKTRAINFVADTINDYRHQIFTISSCETYFFGDQTDEIGESQETDLIKESPTKDAQSDNKLLPEKEEKTKKIDVDTTGRILKKMSIKEDVQSDDQMHSNEPKNPTNRLVKTQILPMRMFHTFAARLATCMFLNIAFIWEPIANGQLKKIDLFLYALYRVYPSQIVLNFVVSGDLQGIDPVIKEKIASEHRMFAKYPVPEMIFRFVDISVAGKLFGAVVIIHNKIESVPDTDRICPANQEVEGWGAIRNKNAATGYSYACEQTPQVYKKLGLDEGAAPEDMVPLKLNKFPYVRGPNEPIEYKSALDRIDFKLDHFKELEIEY